MAATVATAEDADAVATTMESIPSCLSSSLTLSPEEKKVPVWTSPPWPLLVVWVAETTTTDAAAADEEDALSLMLAMEATTKLNGN